MAGGAGEPDDRDEVADGLDLAVPVWAVVEALAMVRPRARVAPSAPAPMAVPMSGRVILTWFSFGLVPVRISRPGGTGQQLGGASQPGMNYPAHTARTASIVSASDAALSGR